MLVGKTDVGNTEQQDFEFFECDQEAFLSQIDLMGERLNEVENRYIQISFHLDLTPFFNKNVQSGQSTSSHETC